MGYAGAITADGVAVQKGAATQELSDTYLQGSIEARRNSIEAVPGSGDILGVCEYKGSQYAWRNNVAGTFADMYCSSSSGWAAVDLGHRIRFGSGSSEPNQFDESFSSAFSYADTLAVGDTLFGETSGATCLVTGFNFISGSLDDGDAVADVYFTYHVGVFVVGEEIRALRAVTNGIGIITVANEDLHFPANGKYEFDIYNFYGHASTINLYGANGVGKAFEFNGATVSFISTGMEDDTPSHIVAHKKHLFLMFSGGSVQHSSLGVPNTFSPITGAAELGLGDEGSGFKKVTGGKLSMYTRNKTYILSGSSAADWVLAEHSEESGAIEWSIQRLASPIYVDDRGLTSLQAVQEFGDFRDNVLSDLIQPYLDSRTDKIKTSMVVKEKNQYRVFFNDKSALYCTFKNNKLIGATPINLGKIVTAAFSGEDTNGEEVLYFGSTDGYVYKLDSGTSLDGEALASALRIPYYHYGTPTLNKRFYSVTLELDLQEPLSTDLTLFPDFTYSDTNAPKALSQSLDPGAGGGVWGAVNWGEFAWGGALVGEAFAHIEGHGRNMGILITSTSIYEKPHTIHGVTVDFAVRNRRR